jgi:hypothetical protein
LQQRLGRRARDVHAEAGRASNEKASTFEQKEELTSYFRSKTVMVVIVLASSLGWASFGIRPVSSSQWVADWDGRSHGAEWLS